MKVKLQILAKDIKESDFFHSDDCAITRALKRAGFPHLKDTGTGIEEKETGRRVAGMRTLGYNKLNSRVQHMYHGAGIITASESEEPADFEMEIALNL